MRGTHILSKCYTNARHATHMSRACYIHAPHMLHTCYRHAHVFDIHAPHVFDIHAPHTMRVHDEVDMAPLLRLTT